MRALQLTMTSSITVAVGSRHSLKYVFQKNRKIQWKTSVLEPFLIKLQASGL